MLMVHYLDEDFEDEYLNLVANVFSDDYYVKMMKAWYFQMAIVKKYAKASVFLENHILEKDVQRMTIEKCLDSYQISEETKKYLKTLRY